MKVLVTGATGFVGSRLCQRMVADGHQVRVLIRAGSDCASVANLPVEMTIGDVTDPESLEPAVTDRDWVIHAAAEVRHSGGDGTRQIAVNVDGTRHVARACLRAGVTRFCHVSSVAAIGIAADPRRPADEDFPFNLEESGWTYHLSKRRAEDVVRETITRGLDAVIVNPATVCGPTPQGYRSIRQLEQARRRWIIPYTPGGVCAVHVSDVADGIVRALSRGRRGERYILGGENASFRAMTETLCQHLGLRRWLIPVPAVAVERGMQAVNGFRRVLGAPSLPAYSRRFAYQFYDSTKARKELGYAPQSLAVIVAEFSAHTRAEQRRLCDT